MTMQDVRDLRAKPEMVTKVVEMLRPEFVAYYRALVELRYE